MTTASHSTVRSILSALAGGLVCAAALAAAPEAFAAGYAVQAIKSPGPAIRMSNSAAVTGFYVAKCTTLSSQPKRTICYNAPWVFDGQRVNKLAGKFPSNANAKAVVINDSRDLAGADLTGAWVYSDASGIVTYVDGADTAVSRGTRIFALTNPGVALGMSYVGGVYQPVTYQAGGLPVPVLSPGKVAVDMNDAGLIAGWSKDPVDQTEHAFLAAADPALGSIDLPKLDPAGAGNCRPVRISQVNAGTGDVWVAGQCAGRPFVYAYNLGDGSSFLSELRFAGSTNLSVQAVNSSGVAVGTAVRPGAAAPDGYTAVVWTTDYSTPVDLNANRAFAPATAWNVHATDINEAGTILAGYNDTVGGFYTLLLKPIP